MTSLDSQVVLLMILNYCLTILKCVFNDSEMLFNDFEMFCLWFEKLFNDFEMMFNDFFNDLSRRSKIFERDTYKGGRGALAPRPPL